MTLSVFFAALNVGRKVLILLGPSFWGCGKAGLIAQAMNRPEDSLITGSTSCDKRTVAAGVESYEQQIHKATKS